MDGRNIREEPEIQACLGLLKLKRSHMNHIESNKYRKTPLQTMVLTEVFKLTGYPSTQTKVDLSLLLNLPISAIQIWFQNERRSRRRRQKKLSTITQIKDNEFFEISVLTLHNIFYATKNRLKTNRDSK